MVSIILGFSVLVILVTAAATESGTRNSGIYLINAAWVDDTEKFKLVSRWGIK